MTGNQALANAIVIQAAKDPFYGYWFADDVYRVVDDEAMKGDHEHDS